MIAFVYTHGTRTARCQTRAQVSVFNAPQCQSAAFGGPRTRARRRPQGRQCQHGRAWRDVCTPGGTSWDRPPRGLAERPSSRWQWNRGPSCKTTGVASGRLTAHDQSAQRGVRVGHGRRRGCRRLLGPGPPRLRGPHCPWRRDHKPRLGALGVIPQCRPDTLVIFFRLLDPRGPVGCHLPCNVGVHYGRVQLLQQYGSDSRATLRPRHVGVCLAGTKERLNGQFDRTIHGVTRAVLRRMPRTIFRAPDLRRSACPLSALVSARTRRHELGGVT